MKKIIKYSLLILLIITLYGQFSHTHQFMNIIHEATYTECGYIEHICECGFSYKDHYVSSTSNNASNNINKYEDEKVKKKINFIISKIDYLIFIDKCLIKLNYKQVINKVFEKEKVYIIYMRFKGDL